MIDMCISSNLLDPAEFLAGCEGLLRSAVRDVLGHSSMYFDDALQEARLKVLKEMLDKPGRKVRKAASFIRTIARRAALEIMRAMATVAVSSNKYWTGKVRTYFFEATTATPEQCGVNNVTPFDAIAHQEDVSNARLLVERARQILCDEPCRYSLWQILCQRLGVCPDECGFLGRKVARKFLAKKYCVTPQAISKAYLRATKTLERAGIQLAEFARALLAVAAAGGQ